MEANFKGKKLTGKAAEAFVKIGLAQEISEEKVITKNSAKKTGKKPAKKK